jgi:hypothetical protein
MARDAIRQREQEFSNLIHKVINNLRIEVDNQLKLERIVYGRKQLQISDTNRKPEDLTKELIIEPLLKFLDLDFKRSGWSMGKIQPREVDYLLEIDNERILVEAEPLNSKLMQD